MPIILFHFPQPFPWHIKVWQDFDTHTMEKVFNVEGRKKICDTFRELVGEPIDWMKANHNGHHSWGDSNENVLKKEVSNFYNRIGCKCKMMAFTRMPDTRFTLVSREYIHRCHMRVKRYIQPSGKFCWTRVRAGAIPEYLTYSENINTGYVWIFRSKALEEARFRLKEKGAYVVADVANLPFKTNAFDGLVSCTPCITSCQRNIPRHIMVLSVSWNRKKRLVVNAWTSPELMKRWSWMVGSWIGWLDWFVGSVIARWSSLESNRRNQPSA